MKFNQIVKVIHHLQVFISIQLLIKVAWGVSFGVGFISLLISEVWAVQKLGLVEKGETILQSQHMCENSCWQNSNVHLQMDVRASSLNFFVNLYGSVKNKDEKKISGSIS